ncbi:MAG: glycosyltransferase family 2 protein [Bacteroidales bacterium]|nr:glycosyltransferase family 2 protein [Bacteroidales bacterium]
MTQPLITVITVVWNDVEHIEQTMLSVLNQTYQNVEYIVIDGGSTDGTVDIIRKYADRLAFWCSERDGGIYPAMNKGVTHATGEWINFMNSGDAFADDKVLEDLFGTTAISSNIKLIGGNTIDVFPGGEKLTKACPASSIPTHLPFSHQATLVRREFCWFDLQYRYSADYALFYDIYFKYGEQSIKIFDRAIARYRQEESLTMNPANQKKIKGEYLRIQRKHPSLHWVKEYIKWRWR